MPTITDYPLPTAPNLTNNVIVGILQYGNSISGGVVTAVILFAFYFITLAATYGMGAKEDSYVVSGFLTLILSFLLFGAGVAHPWWVFLFLIVFLASLWVSTARRQTLG